MDTGAVLHFPAGSYYEQVRNVWRKAELKLMRETWRAAKIAYYRDNDPAKVTDSDMTFVSWAMSTDED